MEETLQHQMKELYGLHLNPQFSLNEDSIQSAEALKNYLINLDIREFGDKVLPKNLIGQTSLEIASEKVFLQIVSIRNVNQSERTQSQEPQLLAIELTDGQTTLKAFQKTGAANISLETPPGTKVLLHKKQVTIDKGLLLLNENSIEVLGGKVESLIVEWEANKRVMRGRNRVNANSSGGPPPFRPLKQKWIPKGSEEQKN